MLAAINLFNRLTEVEKISLRAASDGALEYMANTNFVVDLPGTEQGERVAIVTEARALSNLQFATKGEHPNFGQTWLF